MTMVFVRRSILALVLATLGTGVTARQASTAISAAIRTQLVHRTADELSRGYVFQDVGVAMASLIRKKLSAGGYDSATDPATLAGLLTQDLRSVSHDRHLRIVFALRSAPSPAEGSSGSRRHTLERVERLPGDVGYLKINEFLDGVEMRPLLDKAMQDLRTTDALIVDLATNIGGSPDGVMSLAGFFVPRRTLVAHIYSRLDDSTTEMWTSSVADQPYLGKLLFVLISGRTWSAGEAAAYHLKYLVHAITVGTATGGAAHRIQPVDLGSDFTLLLPFARPINVVTKGDWEGSGVVPELPATPDLALSVAHLAALRMLPASPTRTREIQRLEAEIGPGAAATRPSVVPPRPTQHE